MVEASVTEDLMKAMESLQELLIPDSENKNSALQKSWHFLQVYAIWGLWIPSSEEGLKLRLNIPNPGEFAFFRLMLDSNQDLYQNSLNFRTDIFPSMIKISQDLLNFANMADPDQLGIFKKILEYIENDEPKQALDLILLLRKMCEKSVENAEACRTLLESFHSRIIVINSNFRTVDASIESDQRTSSETIKRLSGDPDDKNSLAYMKKVVDTLLEEYHKARDIALGTVKYAWVNIIGLIAGIVVASIHGSKAAQILKEYEIARAKYEQMNQELITANNTHDTLSYAETCVEEIIKINDVAAQQANIIKNAWNGIIQSLNGIIDQIQYMTVTTDNDEKLAAKEMIKFFMQYATSHWENLLPPLKILTENPYIHLEENSLTLSEFIQSLELKFS